MASPDGPKFLRPVPDGSPATRMGSTAGVFKGMYQQPEPIASSLAIGRTPSEPAGQPIAAQGNPSPTPPERIPRWLVRIELFLRVMLRMYIGIAICYAPWSHTFWDQNPVFLQFPTLSIYASSGAVRGIVSGLGLLNLWFAFQDALRHRDR